MEFHVMSLINAIVYAFLGIVIFVGSFMFVDYLTPYDLWREIVEEKNIALAILIGSGSLGICIIIAAAVH